MTFWLFLLLNAVLLLRPEDLFPSLAGTRLYLILSAICLAAAAPRVLSLLSLRALADRPIVVCMLGLLVAVVLSQLMRGLFMRAADDGGEFAKVVAYFLLFVAIIDTPDRIRTFLGWAVAVVTVLAALGLMQFHGAIDWVPLRPVDQIVHDEMTGEIVDLFPRLRSVGICSDPNDLCLVLTSGTLAALALSATSYGWRRLAWLAPIGLFGYAMMLTHSRGGLLGLAAGLATLAVARLGFRWGLPLALVAVVALLAVFAGRQTDFSLDEADTAQGRLRLWAEGIGLLWRNPLTGIGAHEYLDAVGKDAHNSFVQAYVETGLLGGAFYAGAFFLAVVGVARLPRHGDFWIHDYRFTALQPFILALVVAYAAGTFTLSRSYAVPTFQMLALATTYMRVALPDPPDEYRLNRPQIIRLILVGVGALVFLKFFTQALVRFGP
jgi:putative inorganic carbon (hco3(-)) transporter